MATAVQQIPTSTELAFYTLRVRLDARDYVLHFDWNQREGRWYMGVHDEEDDPIVQSVKVVSNWPLLRYAAHDDRCPKGELMAQTLTADNEPPGFDELGIDRRVTLTYYAAETVL